LDGPLRIDEKTTICKIYWFMDSRLYRLSRVPAMTPITPMELYAKPKQNESLWILGVTDDERWREPLLITDVFYDNRHDRSKISGLWFDNVELDFFSKEEYPEYYL
jgi:hypothetical protein